MREARVSIVNTRRTGDTAEWPDILARARERIEIVSRDRPDIILLSEIFANHHGGNPEAAAELAQAIPGPISEEMASLANRFGTYIAYGLLRTDGRRRFNSLALTDRNGDVAWVYDKVTPVVKEMKNLGITPGSSPKAFDCDFGRVGAAICFDINFVELAETYHRQDAELILFSSAFPAGRLLDTWAVRYGFNIAGSTWYDSNRVIDCSCATVGRTSDLMPAVTVPLNLNRRVVHMDYNLDRLEKMRTRCAGDVLVEDMRDEAVCIITSLKKGLEVADLIREFEIETLHAYFDRSRRCRAEHGGMAGLCL
jgi:predicted amidohydrolase